MFSGYNEYESREGCHQRGGECVNEIEHDVSIRYSPFDTYLAISNRDARKREAAGMSAVKNHGFVT